MGRRFKAPVDWRLNQTNIEALIQKVYIITSELSAKAETSEDVDAYMNSAVVYQKNLRQVVIVEKS